MIGLENVESTLSSELMCHQEPTDQLILCQQDPECEVEIVQNYQIIELKLKKIVKSIASLQGK